MIYDDDLTFPSANVPDYFSVNRKEKMLLLATLIDCLAHHRLCRKKRCAQCQRDTEWIESLEDEYIFSFLAICETLQFPPSFFRNVFQKAKEYPHSEWKKSLDPSEF